MRNYHIVSISEPIASIDGYQKVLTNNIDQIINHSADNILCLCLEYMTQPNMQTLFSALLSKLKPKGQCSFRLANFKALFEDFLNSKVPTSQVFQTLQGKSNILIIEDILSIIDMNTFKVVNIHYDNYNINITIERVAI
jgi:hypothetical protein